MTDQPSFPYKICYVEDSLIINELVKFSLETLLGAQVDLFFTTNEAQKKMREGGYNQWQLFIFDNRTGFGTISGIDLAQEVREKFPEATVVSLNSSDFGEMKTFGIEKLRELGIELWYKPSETFLMIAWVADCTKEGKMISREEWLVRMGEQTRYFDSNERTRPTEFALRSLCMDMERRGLVDESVKGVLMRRDTKDYLQELVSPRRGPERK